MPVLFSHRFAHFEVYHFICWPILAARILVFGLWFCKCSPSHRFHCKQALSSPSSWISEPPSSIVRTEIRSLLSKCTETPYFHVLSSSSSNRCTHAKHCQRQLDVPSGLIWGSNFSDVTSLRSSGLRLHTLTPSAAPAAIAAPSAVVSGMDGFTENNGRMKI